MIFCEDDARIRKLIFHAMQETCHEVLLAEDGEAGLALVRARDPDLLVTDLAMPGLDGLQLYEAIRADPDLAALPIIFLTASDQGRWIARARLLQPRAILVKPFSPAELRRRIDHELA